jgi:hypothetical protein
MADIKTIMAGGALIGHRTKILGALAVVTAIASYCVGDADLQTTLGKVWELLMGMGIITLRSAIDK